MRSRDTPPVCWAPYRAGQIREAAGRLQTGHSALGQLDRLQSQTWHLFRGDFRQVTWHFWTPASHLKMEAVKSIREQLRKNKNNNKTLSNSFFLCSTITARFWYQVCVFFSFPSGKQCYSNGPQLDVLRFSYALTLSAMPDSDRAHKLEHSPQYCHTFRCQWQAPGYIICASDQQALNQGSHSFLLWFN
jgi:hypothetical protein